jgi:hypothetical protein
MGKSKDRGRKEKKKPKKPKRPKIEITSTPIKPGK